MYTPHFCYTPLRRRAYSFSNPNFLFSNSLKASETEALPPKKGPGISHPWPEWTELLEILFKKGFLNLLALDGHGNYNLIRSSCLNFARAHAHLIRYFSEGDIRTMAGAGCPSLDRKVVNSGKRLRAHVGVNEGDVCNSCNFKGSCQRAFVKACDDENGRTVDVMRFLLTYGLGIDNGASNKYVHGSVRRLLKEMVKYRDTESNSSYIEENCESNKNAPLKKGDWICPKCKFMNFAKNIKCLRCASIIQERLDRLREARSHHPLKKGDWICEKCHFFNFVKDSICLQCNEKPPKRNLNPGEWECESCSYINFRNNMVCLKCNWKRPKASNKQHDTSFIRGNDDIVPSCYDHNKSSSEVDHSNFWSCEEDETDEDNDGISRTDFSDHFPAGEGCSGILKDLHPKEMWKERMLKNQENSSMDVNMNSSVNGFCTANDMELDKFDNEDDDI